jgi:hypothetical protein
MRKSSFGGLAALTLALLAAPVSAQTEPPKLPAVLAGHAALPALTLIAPPADAPKGFEVTGKFTAASRVRQTRPGAIQTTSFISDNAAPRSTGVGLPLEGQAVQGFSAIAPLGDGRFLALTDNGFGSRVNSPDALLMVHTIRPDWNTGRVARESTNFLHDPDHKLPFHIVNENTNKRYLTGADLDPESLVVVNGELWIGEEFGPYLLRFDASGKLLAFHETKVGDRTFQAPDHFRMGLPNVPGTVVFDVRRSRGFEPMGRSADGRFLYPAFEGPLWDAKAGAFENDGGRQFARILEFDVAAGAYSGRWWKYPLADNANVLGDLAMVDADSAVVIERDDNSEGAPSQACTGPVRSDCFNRPAAFKRVVKIVMGASGEAVRKVAQIDLLEIRDPDRRAQMGHEGGKFVLPHLGPEGIAIVDAERIVLVNDNNLPYSSGRAIGKPDDNEVTLLFVPELLNAR